MGERCREWRCTRELRTKDSDVRFEWDDRKALENAEKHGVTFVGSHRGFLTTQTQLRAEDVDHSNDETRFFIIGYSSSRVLFVVFAERLGNVIRIISARPPTPSERKLYEEHER